MSAGAFTVTGSAFRVTGVKTRDRRFLLSSSMVRWWGGLYARDSEDGLRWWGGLYARHSEDGLRWWGGLYACHSEDGLHGGRKARPTGRNRTVRGASSRSGLRPDRRAPSCTYAAVKAGRRPALLAGVMRGI